MSELHSATLLLVDDEENILKSLRRLLRHEPYDILTAGDAAQAMQLLDQQPIDLIVSDARMPGMDGASLLAEVQQRWPDCLRILLTGHADIGTMVKAINEGHIYRYISKPWDDDELRLTIRQALAFQHSERERKRLEQLTYEQNQRLLELNTNLEQRVRDRTAELQQTADMLDLAYAELKRSYVTATEVFSALLNQRLPRDKHSNAQVIALVRAYAEGQHWPEAQQRDLTMAAALYNLGKLTWSDSLLNSPADLLYKQERARYRQYPVAGESLLMALEPLQDAARLIRHHQERWDGAGFPDRLKGEAIPVGARLLKLAVDFVELQCGLVLDRRLNRDEALLLIQKYSGKLYDPALCEQFIHLCTTLAPDLALADASIMALDTRRLEPGMLLARNLHAESGTLLLNEGKQLNRALIDKLIAFEESEGARYTLFVRPAPQPSPVPETVR
ncbi:HD domain-containing phosphohydrolase [Pseudomonas sp. UBA2684]|uniref:HD domain-containing phosphohydrolase n=1 Tax=Pseudomonas sp. UBA2684 TaxID=1947311 RepID=UPI000E94F31C|nr:HD domain-containing phosphohydrolase [Pseudomonas sp. UBA2684]HBX55887.1 two-component system response regulator [Pseudomonas sp.]|tara:strand:+ start:4812 stop:6152 length:1341 start_codon:yes stop_codon:yes gene_type:complete